MKNVIIYDSYARVLDADGTTILHEANGSEIIVFSNETFENACTKVEELFEESKTLGSSYTEVVSQPELGLVEIKVEFPDKRKLHRVIYLKDS
jgi:hypothetical protein